MNQGRLLDKDEPSLGRFTRDEVKSIMNSSLKTFTQLLQEGNLEKYKNTGNRHAVMLSMNTVAIYRAFLKTGIKIEYALEGHHPREIVEKIVSEVEVPKDWARGQ